MQVSDWLCTSAASPLGSKFLVTHQRESCVDPNPSLVEVAQQIFCSRGDQTSSVWLSGLWSSHCTDWQMSHCD